jgi:hypothetical protein
MTPGASFGGLVKGWAASVALDGVLDDGARLKGGRSDEYEVPVSTRLSTGTTPTRASPSP